MMDTQIDHSLTITNIKVLKNNIVDIVVFILFDNTI